MGTLLVILGVVFLIVAVVCSLIPLIDAFKNEVWKGVLYLVCGIYGLYYMIAEFQHPRKWLIIVGFFAGWIVGYALMFAGGVSMMPTSPTSPSTFGN